MFAVQIWCADFKRDHPKFCRNEAREWNLQLRIWHEENALAAEQCLIAFERALGAFTPRGDDTAEVHFIHAERFGGGIEPGSGAFRAEREKGIEPLRAAIFQRGCGVAKKRLSEKEAGVGAFDATTGKLLRTLPVVAGGPLGVANGGPNTQPTRIVESYKIELATVPAAESVPIARLRQVRGHWRLDPTFKAARLRH